MDLVMAIHCHQPVGNFDHVFEMAHEKCYRPVLDLLEKYPMVRVGLHFSGPLLEWFEMHRPATLDLMTALVGRGQVEPLSGGFFEPLLATIPVQDARGQVVMMNDYLERRLGRRPTGFWLTERVWDPNLPLTLAGTGMAYTVVDDTHFYYAGLKPNEIYGRYVTEREGQTLSLLATPMVMRYLIPFKAVDEVMGHLKTMHEEGRALAVYGDDGEKFGLWPGTHEWVIQKGWLERFFSAVSDSGDWLKTVLPGEYTAASEPLGRLYLPQASYEEMTEWALPAERGQALEEIIGRLKDEGRWEHWRPFVRGGVWDNFLVKYEEANRMHKKMLFLSKAIPGDGKEREHLWRAQCNCAYWHGVFGGLYLGHLRRAIHENLIRAQAGLPWESGGDSQVMRLDLDKDGADEILIRTPELSLGLDPGEGGGLFEICHLPGLINLSDTLTRRAEAYHRLIRDAPQGDAGEGEGIPSIHDLPGTPEEGLEGHLVYDAYTRASLLDHFLPSETGPDRYAANEFEEQGDFVRGRYELEQAGAVSGEAVVMMSRTGRAGSGPLHVRKALRAGREGGMSVAYEIENRGPDPLSLLYGCEFNLTLFSDRDPERYYMLPDSGTRREVSETGGEDGVERFELVNNPDGIKVVFAFSPAISAWFFPLMTVSKSEEGFERTYQGSSLLFVLPLNLSSGEGTKFNIRLEFSYSR